MRTNAVAERRDSEGERWRRLRVLTLALAGPAHGPTSAITGLPPGLSDGLRPVSALAELSALAGTVPTADVRVDVEQAVACRQGAA